MPPFQHFHLAGYLKNDDQDFDPAKELPRPSLPNWEITGQKAEPMIVAKSMRSAVQKMIFS